MPTKDTHSEPNQDHKLAKSDRIEADVASELTEAERSQLSDSNEVARYVRATNGVKTDALKRLRDTFEWRRKERPRTVTCNYCEAIPRSHYMHVASRSLPGFLLLMYLMCL